MLSTPVVVEVIEPGKESIEGEERYGLAVSEVQVPTVDESGRPTVLFFIGVMMDDSRRMEYVPYDHIHWLSVPGFTDGEDSFLSDETIEDELEEEEDGTENDGDDGEPEDDEVEDADDEGPEEVDGAHHEEEDSEVEDAQEVT